MVVVRQLGRAEARMSATWDAIVIGAGPAGMRRRFLPRGGWRALLVVDEQAELGGQIYRAVERNSVGDDAHACTGRWSICAARSFVTRLRASGAVLMLATGVGGSMPVRPSLRCGLAVTACSPATRRVDIVVATGAIERPVPVEGWTLPGVMSVGGLADPAQTPPAWCRKGGLCSPASARSSISTRANA